MEPRANCTSELEKAGLIVAYTDRRGRAAHVGRTAMDVVQRTGARLILGCKLLVGVAAQAHRKQLLLHTEDAVARIQGEPREILERLLPKLKAQVNRDVAADFQDISTACTFADDKSLFDMALEVGLEDPYHSVMIPASSAL